MAQQSARRDRDNQAATPYFEYATLIWTRSANSHAGRRSMTAQGAGQMAASDYASRHSWIFSLALKGASTDVAWIAGWRRELGDVGGRPLPGYSDPRRAVQSQGGLSPPHSQAAAPGDQLGRV